MTVRRTIALALCTMAISVAVAADVEFPDVSNTSFVEANGDRTIQLSVTLAATPDEAFAAFATPEGWMAWAAPFATGEGRIGGVIETSYQRDAKPGDAGNIQNRIVAWLPGRLFVMQTVKTPDGFPEPEAFKATVTIIAFDPIDGGRATRVTLSHAGFGAGAAFDLHYANFTWGDAYALTMLKRRFDSGPIDWAAEAAKTEATP